MVLNNMVSLWLDRVDMSSLHIQLYYITLLCQIISPLSLLEWIHQNEVKERKLEPSTIYGNMGGLSIQLHYITRIVLLPANLSSLLHSRYLVVTHKPCVMTQ